MTNIENTRVVGEAIEIKFDNNYHMAFIPYRHGFGYQIEGMYRTVLTNEKDEVLCKINHRLHYSGPQEDEHKIVTIDNITQPEVAEYWKIAKDFISKKFDLHGDKNDDYWYYWKVVCMEGYFDLERLKENKMEMLKNKDL